MEIRWGIETQVSSEDMSIVVVHARHTERTLSGEFQSSS